MKPIICILLSLTLLACTSADVETSSADLGQPSSLLKLQQSLQQPGPIKISKHVAADWQVPLSGLLNLDHPKAQAAGLEDRKEKIQIYVYALRHPEHGLFLVDSGVSKAFTAQGRNPDVARWVHKVMGLESLQVRLTTEQLSKQFGVPAGVLLTHIHFDHIMGLTDLPSSVPVYIGPGDTRFKTATNMASRGTTNRMLANVTSLREWQFDQEGIVDVFGDGSLWAIHTPGHTPGATAYLANTTQGPHLMMGDATHTRWGWDNGVEAGSYSEDVPESARSLAKLKQLVENNPNIIAHPGHQP